MGKPFGWILVIKILAVFYLTILVELHRPLYDRLCPVMSGAAVGSRCTRVLLGHDGHSGLGQTWAVHYVCIEHLQKQVIQRHYLLHLHAVQVVHTFVTEARENSVSMMAEQSGCAVSYITSLLQWKALFLYIYIYVTIYIYTNVTKLHIYSCNRIISLVVFDCFKSSIRAYEDNKYCTDVWDIQFK